MEFQIINYQVRECLSVIKFSMKDSGKMVCLMDKGQKLLPTEISLLAIFLMAKSMEIIVYSNGAITKGI